MTRVAPARSPPSLPMTHRPAPRCGGHWPAPGTANRSTRVRRPRCCTPAATTWTGCSAYAGRTRDAGLAAAGRPGVITYSRKVFIPLTRLCRDRCGYCTFATVPGRLDSPYLSAGRGARHRPPGCRPRLQGSPVHPRRPPRGQVGRGPRLARRQRVRRHALLRPGHGHPGAGGDRPAAAPQPRRADLARLPAAQAGRAVHGHDARDHRGPAVHRAGRPALRQPGQGPGGPAAGAGGRRPLLGPVHHGHPHRHRGDPRRARRVAVRHPPGRPGVRRHPGSHRAELPRQAGHQDARGPGRGTGRPGGDDRRGPAGARPVRPDPGAAEPHRRPVRPDPGGRDRRLGRRVAAHPGPRQPGAAVAADRGAGPPHAGRGDAARRTAHDLPRVPARAVARPAAGRARGRARRPGDRAGPRGRRPARPAVAGARRRLGRVVRPHRPARHDRHDRADHRPPRRLRRGVRRLGRGGHPDRPGGAPGERGPGAAAARGGRGPARGRSAIPPGSPTRRRWPCSTPTARNSTPSPRWPTPCAAT